MSLFNSSFRLGRPALAALFFTGCAFAADPAFVLTSTTAINGSTIVSGGNWRWAHGGFIMVDMVNPLVKSFTVAGRDGSILSSFDFSIPETTHVWVLGFDRDSAGNLVFSGEAYSSDGRLAPFIGIKPPNGGDVHLIRTYPYWPVALALAPDGTIWTVGGEWTYDRKSSGDSINPNGDAVRHFDRTGKLLGSAIPGQTLHPKYRHTDGFLVATADRVGWYSPTQGPGTYIEFSPANPKEYKVYSGLPDAKSRAQGFALTDSGKAFVTNEVDYKIATYTLDRATNQWTAVSFPSSDSSSPLTLRGSEKDTLVLEGVHGLHFFDAAAK